MTRPELELTETEDPPLEIPGYQLLEPVGEGGTGRVYRALQLSLQRTVAIKLLRIGPGRHPTIAFERESRLLASLAHPNLVTVFDCGQVKDHYYIVTEYIQGSTLRPMLKPGQPWTIQRAFSMLDRVASALSYIHAKGILHLDLKPENILCDSTGEPKIADFGLALSEIDAQAMAAAGEAQGTPDYCAPEQRFGLPTSERTDLFSLAVMAYELLTGSLPGRVYQSARQLNPLLPNKVDRVLQRGLARSQEDRLSSVEDFRRELQRSLQRRKIQSRHFLACAMLVLLLGVALPQVSNTHRSPGSVPIATPQPVQAWVLHDYPDHLNWFDLGGMDEASGLIPRPLLVQGRLSGINSSPPLPLWPATRPVLVVSSPNNLGFVHPLSDPTLGRRVLKNWQQLIELPPTPSENNFCVAGNFSGNCLAEEHADKTRPWHLLDPSMIKLGNVIAIADPPDQSGNPALLLHRKETLSPIQDIGCYQWLSRIPERAGTITVMRYRVRAEEGEGRLAVRIELPLLLPIAADDETTLRLRGLSIPFPDIQHGMNEEPRHYRFEDWITPTREWQTCYVIWEWPPYCQDPSFRNLVVLYPGTGKVWLDDVEIFTWELGREP
jgi:serine/threonine protein kinase